VFIIEDDSCMNSALCWDCNIIIPLFIYIQWKIVGWESQQTMPNGGSWVSQKQISMPRSLTRGCQSVIWQAARILAHDNQHTTLWRWNIVYSNSKQRVQPWVCNPRVTCYAGCSHNCEFCTV